MNLSLPLQLKRVAIFFCVMFFSQQLCFSQSSTLEQSEDTIGIGGDSSGVDSKRRSKMVGTPVFTDPDIKVSDENSAASKADSLSASDKMVESPVFIDSEAKPDNTVSFEFDFETHTGLKNSNLQHANFILEKLYCETTEDFAGTTNDPIDDLSVGTQAGYYAKPGTQGIYSPLVRYGRVWAHDAGTALSLAVKNRDPQAHKRVLWFRKHSQTAFDPSDSRSTLFVGWPFSKNQVYLGDDWTDCRLITGANARALLGVGDYITSEFYRELSADDQAYYQTFFEKALEGILYHIELDGPNEGLISAGWSLNVIEEFHKTGYSYDEVISMVGYGPAFIDGYPSQIKRVRARNIATDHCSNVLALVNYALDNYDQLFRPGSELSRAKLALIRLKLRESMFINLYDYREDRFISGRTESGESSEYASVSNTAWFCLSLKLNELNKKQVGTLSRSLLYTVKSFTKDFVINGKTYFGAFYFQNGFEDPSIEEMDDLHSNILHVEGTCMLINSLLRFTDAFPENSNTPLFHATAIKLWNSLQYLIDDYGFIYDTSLLKSAVDEDPPLESSVSALCYLRIYNYFDANPERYDLLD